MRICLAVHSQKTLASIIRGGIKMKDVIQKTLTAGTETEFEREKEDNANV